jgi:uncharacterized protein YqhQ
MAAYLASGDDGAILGNEVALDNEVVLSDETALDEVPAVADEEQTSCTWEHTFGGQAVIEGVMMRGKHSWGMAVRRPSGGIARVSYPLETLGSRYRWLRLPVVRGVVSLYESMSLGIKALGISANIGLEDPNASADEVPVDAGAATEQAAEKQAFGWKELTVTVLVAVAFAVGLFVVVPLAVVKYFEDIFANPFVFNLVEGIIRIIIFILYIVVVSLLPDLRRVFQYHGAEHKVIHAYESCGRPDAQRAVGFSPRHPRCGTGFLLLVMVIAVFVFAIVGKPSLPWLVLSRLLGIPLIIGISYEIGIKWAGRHPNGFFAHILLWPGIQLQRLTTREPTPDQLEVAVAALEEVMRQDEVERVALAELAAET